METSLSFFLILNNEHITHMYDIHFWNPYFTRNMTCLLKHAYLHSLCSIDGWNYYIYSFPITGVFFKNHLSRPNTFQLCFHVVQVLDMWSHQLSYIVIVVFRTFSPCNSLPFWKNNELCCFAYFMCESL